MKYSLVALQSQTAFCILHKRGDSNWMEMGQQLGDRNEQQLGNNIWMEIKMSNIWRSNLFGDQHGR